MTLGQSVLEVHPPEEAKPKDYTIGQTLGRMASAVVHGEDDPRFDPEDEHNLTEEQRGYSVASAFDRGAKLNLPEPPSGPLDDSYQSARARAADRRPTPARRPTGKGVAGSDELTKLFATGFITLITFTLGDWALPTAEEATELSRPLANMLARRIDLAAKLGKDGNDVIAFSIAIMAYMVRVGPIAGEKAKNAWSDRQQRTRVDRVLSGRPEYSDGESGVPDGADAGSSTSNGTAPHPFDAIAKARDAGLRGLDRQFGYDQGPAAPVGNVR